MTDEDVPTSMRAPVALSSDWVGQAFPAVPNAVEVSSPGPESSPSGIATRRFEVVRPHGVGFREFATPTENLHLMLADLCYENTTVAKADGHDFLKFHFKMAGHNLVRFDKGHEYLLTSGTSVIAYHPRGLLKDDCYAPKAREQSLTLSCKIGLLLELMRVEPEDLPAPLSRYFTAKSPDFFCHTLPLTAEMLDTIQAIMRPRFDGHLRRLQIEARSLDLICLLLDALTRSGDRDVTQRKIRAREVEALRAVREYLELHHAAPPSISVLARRFGINRTKLTEGFRLAFGQTIYDYVQCVRMQQAKQLLLDTNLPIALVAEKVGFERQTSFATAFRRHFGFTPRNMKRLRN